MRDGRQWEPNGPRSKVWRNVRSEKRTHAAGIYLAENPNDGLRKARPLRNIADTPIPRTI